MVLAPLAVAPLVLALQVPAHPLPCHHIILRLLQRMRRDATACRIRRLQYHRSRIPLSVEVASKWPNLFLKDEEGNNTILNKIFFLFLTISIFVQNLSKFL